MGSQKNLTCLVTPT